MRIQRLIQWGDFLYWTHRQLDTREVRISPRSYRAGEQVGFISGVTTGFVLGVLALAAVFGWGLS